MNGCYYYCTIVLLELALLSPCFYIYIVHNVNRWWIIFVGTSMPVFCYVKIRWKTINNYVEENVTLIWRNETNHALVLISSIDGGIHIRLATNRVTFCVWLSAALLTQRSIIEKDESKNGSNRWLPKWVADKGEKFLMEGSSDRWIAAIRGTIGSILLRVDNPGIALRIQLDVSEACEWLIFPGRQFCFSAVTWLIWKNQIKLAKAEPRRRCSPKASGCWTIWATSYWKPWLRLLVSFSALCRLIRCRRGSSLPLSARNWTCTC